jgi:O-antigen/teichoic acid export membrane protein
MSTVSKNILWSTATSIFQLYTGSVVFIVLAKLMSVEEFGILSFGYSLSALVVIVSDFGFSLMLIKEYPNQLKQLNSYLFSGVIVKVLISSIGAILFCVYLVFFYENELLSVGTLFILFGIVFSFVTYFQSLLKIQNNFRKYAGTTMMYAFSITVAIVVYWLFPITVTQLAYLMILAKIVQLLWSVYVCRDSFSSFTYKKDQVKSILKGSWSYGVYTIFGVFYLMIDTQIIALYYDSVQVALYQAVFRILLIMLLFTDIISNVLLPYLSFKYHKNESIGDFSSKIFLYMLIIACSMFLVLTTFDEEIILVLYTSEYVNAVVLMLPFSFIIIIRAVSALFGSILTISNKQTFRVVAGGISLLISITLNFILIPKFGIIAAAWVSVFVHFVLFLLYYMLLLL